MYLSVVLCYEPDFWQLALVFSAFYKHFLETSFYSTPPGQIISCHVTEVKMLPFFDLLNHDPVGL